MEKMISQESRKEKGTLKTEYEWYELIGVRLARAYLDAMGAEESDSQGSSEDDSDGKGDISFQLKRHRLESQGKYVRLALLCCSYTFADC